MARKKISKSGPDALEIVSKGMKSEGTYIDAVPEELIIPTRFTSFNRATGVGGLPLRRTIAIHGPTSRGKSVLGVILCLSAVDAGMAAFYEDAEFASEKEWLRAMIRRERIGFAMIADLNEFFFEVDTGLRNIEKDRKLKKGKLAHDGIGALWCIDTLSELLPADVMDKMEAAIKKGKDFSQFPAAAKLLDLWYKKSVPRFYRTNSTLVAILQERSNMGASSFEPDWRPAGANTILFNASLQVRCGSIAKVTEGDTHVGAKTTFEIRKNKVDGTVYSRGEFFVSNGKGRVPAGIDYYREALFEAKARKLLVTKKDAQVTTDDWPGEPVELPDGILTALEAMLEEPKILKRLVAGLNKHARRAA